jgi:hypothetical protein
VRRCAWIVALASLLAIVPVTASNAGGWDSLSFPQDHYLVGHVASTTQMFYAARLNGAGELDGGPYYAYLLPLGDKNAMGLGMIDPPNVPAGAIQLGMLQVSGPFDKPGYKGPYGRASLTFTVPDVPTGRYSIGFCDDPCRHGYVGWLAWASITIVHTEEEGRLLASLDRRFMKILHLRGDLRKAEAVTAKFEDRVASLGADLRERTMALRAAGARQAAPPSQPGDSRPLISWWAVALLAVALVTAVVIAWRRGRPSVRVPNTVPDEPIERERTSV